MIVKFIRNLGRDDLASLGIWLKGHSSEPRKGDIVDLEDEMAKKLIQAGHATSTRFTRISPQSTISIESEG